MQTGIATALALGVVAVIFIFPGLSPFPSTPPAGGPTSAAVDAGLTTNTEPSATMPPPTSLQITDEVVGTGAVAVAGDTVTVNYVGSFTNGTVFDASANHGTTGFDFVLGAGRVIAGWDQGVAGMKVGGKRHLVIPPSLGYGPNDYGPIPANSTLLFEVELVKVVKAAQ